MKKLLSMLVMASMMVFALGTMGASAAAKAPKNDKAVVVVSFGSTFDDTRTKDIGGIEEAVAKAFPNRDFKRAFTSYIIMERLEKNKGIKVNDLPATLKELKKAGYKDILVQPTHLLHGEEYEHKVLTTVDKFKGDFDRIVVSDPLMVGKNDFAIAASAVATQFPTLGKGEGVVLMGHGSPRDNNQSFGNTYKMLQETFDKMGLPVVVGTVEEVDTPNVDEVLEQIKARGYKTVDILVKVYAEGHSAEVRISRTHCNIAYIRRDGEMIYHEDAPASEGKSTKADRSLLTIENIVRFAEDMDIADVKEVLDRQISYNYAIALEGMQNDWGANIGSTLVKTYGDDVKIMSKAMAAAGSDARMSGCELPVVINSGSGNQGITVSVPVIVYAERLRSSQEELYRALAVSNLTAVHIKHGIGPLSAFCGAVSAGCAAGCGIAYLFGGREEEVSHTLVNSLATVSGIFCDGAKASCAAKIASSVEAGILGYYMYTNGQQFYAEDGIVSKGVENTIRNVCRLGGNAMNETDEEIIRIMTHCD